MNPETWRKIQDLFQAALEREPRERPAFLDEACAGDPALRAGVERLLASDAHAGSFLEGAIEAGARALAEERGTDMTGRLVGPYRIKQLLGHGGMSSVYLAFRADDQYQKRVALKLVKRGMDTEEILQRFRNERQVLAGLDHPDIARLLDGGTTEDGLPYFVMEYIDGVPIDEYCDTHKLSTAARLDLFCAICSAVHYAHQNLVVHRDIKPGNILVTAEGVPKLLDFGIARMMNPDLTLHTMQFTAAGQRLMTPEFASPEQIRGRTITTASDVYSLGVLLYLLLTGHQPYVLHSHQPQEIERIVCATDPPRPSTSVTRVEEVPASDGHTTIRITPELVGDLHGERPDRLRRKLAGDLDNIVLKALRKDPQRRYGSALQLAEDIRRHLEGRPVLARKDTPVYRTSKWIRRNKIGSAFILSVCVFGVAMTLQSIRAARERDQAAKERDRAEQVSALLVNLFEISDPNKSKGATVPAREILDQGAARIGKELEDQPEVRAKLMDTMGRVYQNLGLYDKAGELLEGSVAIERQTLGAAHPDLATGLDHLGVLLRIKGDYPRADSLLRESLRIRRAAFGPEHADVASSLNDLGENLTATGSYAAAESLFRRALDMRTKLLGPNHVETIRSLSNLGRVLYQEGDLNGAERLMREALELKRHAWGEDHPEVTKTLNNLAMVLTDKGDYSGAESLFREVVAIRRKTLGEGHPDVATAMVNLAAVLPQTGKSREAESLVVAAIAIKRGALGEDHPDVANALGHLADMQVARGDTVGAEASYREALAIYAKKWPGGHPDASVPMLRLGMLLTGRGRLQEAQGLLRDDVRLEESQGSPDEEAVAEAQCALGACEVAMGHYPAAESLLSRYSPALLKEAVDVPIPRLQILDWMIGLYDAWGKPERAAEYRRRLAGLAASPAAPHER